MKKRNLNCLVLILIVALLVFCGTGALIFLFFNGTAKLASEVVFLNQISDVVHSNIERIRATNGNKLLLAEIESREKFTHEDVVKWNLPILGETQISPTATANAEVNATYRYCVNLDDGVTVNIRKYDTDVFCEIVAPPLHPLTPVAFDSQTMKVETGGTWKRVDLRAENLRNEMTKKITPHLERRAAEMTPLAREKAREQFANFARKWLLDAGVSDEKRIIAVKVIFRDEESAPGKN